MRLGLTRTVPALLGNFRIDTPFVRTSDADQCDAELRPLPERNNALELAARAAAAANRAGTQGERSRTDGRETRRWIFPGPGNTGLLRLQQSSLRLTL